jgi:hypothetical protein
MNPFAQLMSPQALMEAIESSVELKQLPGKAYRQLDSLRAPPSKEPVSAHAAALKGSLTSTTARPKWLPFTSRWQ